MQPDSRLALAGIISIILAFALIIAALLLPGAIRRAPPGHPQGVAHSHGSSGEQQSGDDKGEGQYNADDTGKRESRIWLHISILSSSFFRATSLAHACGARPEYVVVCPGTKRLDTPQHTSMVRRSRARTQPGD